MPLYKKQLNHQIAGNTSGATANIATGTYFLAGGNNVTLSQNANSVTISAGSAAASPVNFSAGTTSNNLGSVVFSNSNNATFGLNGSTVTVSSPVSFSAGTTNNNLTNIVFSNSNGVNFGLNGSTVTASVTASTMNFFQDPYQIFYPGGLFSHTVMSVKNFYSPFYVTGSAMKVGVSMSAATNTSVTTASANMTVLMGIYTRNGDSLSLASSGSASYAWAWSVSNSSTANTSINSIREITVPMNVNMTPGEYWAALHFSRNTTYTSFAMSVMVSPNFSSPAHLAPIGSNTSVARAAIPMQGVFLNSGGATALTANLVRSQINYTSASVVSKAAFWHQIYNTTY